MLGEHARKLYIQSDLNCAEAVMRSADEVYKYQFPDECYHMIGAFGGGCSVGDLCGAVAGSVAVLGNEFIAESAHSTPLLSDRIRAFMNEFGKEFSSFSCRDIKPVCISRDEDRCALAVQKAAECLELILDRYCDQALKG